MSTHNSADLHAGLDRLRRIGRARNREVDREIREVCMTDDEAAAVAEYIDQLEGTKAEYGPCERGTVGCSVVHGGASTSCQTW